MRNGAMCKVTRCTMVQRQGRLHKWAMRTSKRYYSPVNNPEKIKLKRPQITTIGLTEFKFQASV